MNEEGKILSSYEIDDNLALQIWTRGKSPRLSIFNKNKNTRKLIQLSWVEKRDRKLQINSKTRGETVSYIVQDFEHAIQKILEDFTIKTNFRLKFFRVMLDLEKALFNPEIVTSQNGFVMMSDEKRSALFIADCTGEDKKSGVFKNFFPLNDAERMILNNTDLNFINGERNVETLLHTGLMEAMGKINPERWFNPVRVSASAMLLCFSFCGEDGSKFSNSLWENRKPHPQETNKHKGFSLNSPGLMKLGFKISAYMRHFYNIENLNVEYFIDSEKFLQDEGYTRSRRTDFTAGTLGDVPYRVTFYEHELNNITAFACVPQMATAKHSGEMVIKIPTDLYNEALKIDTMNGGNQDEFYTITRLFWAKNFKEWYYSVMPYVKSFSGLK